MLFAGLILGSSYTLPFYAGLAIIIFFGFFLHKKKQKKFRDSKHQMSPGSFSSLYIAASVVTIHVFWNMVISGLNIYVDYFIWPLFMAALLLPILFFWSYMKLEENKITPESVDINTVNYQEKLRHGKKMFKITMWLLVLSSVGFLIYPYLVIILIGSAFPG